MSKDTTEMSFAGGGRRAKPEEEPAPRPKLSFYMVSDPQGRSETLTAEQIEERLFDGRLAGDALARLDGEAPQPLTAHKDFERYFRSGTEDYQRRITGLERVRIGEETRAPPPPPPRPKVRLSRVAAPVLAALLFGLAGVVAWLASEAPPAPRLPGQELVEGFAAAHPDAGAPLERLDLTWVGLTERGRVDWADARARLERHLAAQPEDGEAAAALSVVYARLAEDDRELRPATVAMMQRAQTLEPDVRTLARLSAGMALFGAPAAAALDEAEVCLNVAPEDGVCWWYQGQALLSTGHYKEGLTVLRAASAALGAEDAVDYALLAQSALASGELAAAEQALDEQLKRSGGDREVLLSQARFYRAIGEYDRAIAAARRATGGDAVGLEAGLLLGSLLLHHKGDARAASAALQELATRPLPDGQLGTDVLAQASIAARWAGDSGAALALAERLVALRPKGPEGALALAEALAASGRPEGVERALQDARLARISEDRQARFHRASAALFERLGWEGKANAARAEGRLLAPESVDLPLEEAAALLDRGSEEVAAAVVLATWRFDPLAEVGLDPVSNLPVALPSLAALAARLDRVGRRGSPERQQGARAAAAVRAIRCVRGEGGCGDARDGLLSVLKSAPDDPAANLWLAQVMFASGQSGAERYIALATRGLSSAPFVTALEGLVMARRGATGSAQVALESAARAEDQPAVLRRVAEGLLLLGDVDEAISTAKRAAAASPEDWQVRALLLKAQRERAAER